MLMTRILSKFVVRNLHRFTVRVFSLERRKGKRDKREKKEDCCNSELHASTLLLTQQSAKQQLRATNGAANRKVNIKLNSRIYQRSYACISVPYVSLLPPPSPFFSSPFFSFPVFKRRQVRSARDSSFCQRGRGETKKCVRTFRKDAFRNEKCEKQKQRAGNKTKLAVGRRAVTKKKKSDGIGANSGFHAAAAAASTHRSSPTLSFDSLSLVVLCHHSSCLTICPRIRFYLSPDLSSIVFQTVLFQASDPLSCSRHRRATRIAPPPRHRPPESHR